MTRTRAIVFDMDGVLIDSEELHAHAKRIAFAQAGIASKRIFGSVLHLGSQNKVRYYQCCRQITKLSARCLLETRVGSPGILRDRLMAQ